MSEATHSLRPEWLVCGSSALARDVQAAALAADLPIDVRVHASTDPNDLESLLTSAAPHLVILADEFSDPVGLPSEELRSVLAAAETPWILVLGGDAVAPDLDREARALGGLGAIATEALPHALPPLVGCAALLSESREEVVGLRRNVTWLSSFRRLAECLEPGTLYPMALDLLLEASGRTRALSVFRRDGPGKGDTAALRGFTETESSEICASLLESKRLDLADFEAIRCGEDGPVHAALRGAGVEVHEIFEVPVAGDEGQYGVLFLLDDGRGFDEHVFSAAELLASQARVAIRNAEAYAMAKDRAFIDDVTEVYNARYLLQTADNEIQRAERYGNPLSVLFLDLDRFKRVNDEWGHLIGSDTLRKLSRLLLGCVRQVDTLARYGGDEFTILLVDTDHAAALQIAERIRRGVESHVFEVGAEARLRLSISIGVATCPDHSRDREGLLDASDKAMYRAKSDGRNRVCSASDL